MKFCNFWACGTQVSCFLKKKICILNFFSLPLMLEWSDVEILSVFLGFTLGSQAFVTEYLETDLKLCSHWGLITQSAALKILTQNSLWDWDGWEAEKLIRHSGPEGAGQSKSKSPTGKFINRSSYSCCNFLLCHCLELFLESHSLKTIPVSWSGFWAFSPAEVLHPGFLFLLGLPGLVPGEQEPNRMGSVRAPHLSCSFHKGKGEVIYHHLLLLSQPTLGSFNALIKAGQGVTTCSLVHAWRWFFGPSFLSWRSCPSSLCAAQPI